MRTPDVTPGNQGQERGQGQTRSKNVWTKMIKNKMNKEKKKETIKTEYDKNTKKKKI